MADHQSPRPEDERPLVAPCKPIPIRAPLHWLRLGWEDVKRAPRQSLTYGAIMTILGYLISAAAYYFGDLGLYLGLVSGFVFLGPLLALTLYDISARLETGQPVSLRESMNDARQRLGDAMTFTIILLVVFLIWARAATMLHVFFPADLADDPLGLAMFLGIGSAVGACFCAIIFTASAFSLPMILDRDTDMITAVVTSVNAVLRNKPAMVVWASLITGCMLVGVITAYLGLVVVLPLLGHATWHAYRQSIDASEWPKNPALYGGNPDALYKPAGENPRG